MSHWKLVWAVALVAVFSSVIASQTPSGHAVFEQALAKERVDGNLTEAIRLYERVVTEFASDRALAAKALVQMGLCYEKLGRDEAVRAYERIVRDFADQEVAVEQARARLAALRRPASGAAAGATTTGVRAFPRVDDSNNAVLALSPDGTKAAFGIFDKGQNLALYDVASRRTTRLTDFDWTASSFWVDHAAWSADGRRIAYMQCRNRSEDCALRVTTLAGESREIFHNEAGRIMPAGWLPDGSALVVMLGRADRTFSIGLVPTAGGPFTPLRSIGWTEHRPELPSVSPDGRLIAFAEGSLGSREIHVIGRDGRTAHRVTDHPADDHRPLWSPDGHQLVFLSTRNGSAALWTVALRDGKPVAEPVRVKDGMQGANLLGWTTRGLAYSEYLRTDDIYIVPVDPASGEPGGSPRQIPYRRTGRNIAPGWSPDGKYLAFVSSSPAEPDRRTVVLLPGGSGEARDFPIPTSHFRYLQEPYDLRWFGDSRGLGFSGYDAKGERTLFRLTLATGEWKTVPLPVNTGTRTDWNSDGSRYFYWAWQEAGSDATTIIVERDVQSDREQIVLRRPCRVDPQDNLASALGCMLVRGFRFSPDRRLLAINGNNIARQGIVVLNIETGQTRVVYDEAVNGTLNLGVPTWSPNGRALLVAWTEHYDTDRQATDLRLIPIDGGEVRRIPLGAELTRLISTGRGASKPTIDSIAWSPDGGSLAFVLRASRVETWVLENPLALAGALDARSRK